MSLASDYASVIGAKMSALTDVEDTAPVFKGPGGLMMLHGNR
jgi:hypothetical protein